MNLRWVLFSAILFTTAADAGDTLDAAIGGGIGGAAGAAIGNEVGGREGAVLGGALGAAVGAAVATDSDGHASGQGHHETHVHQEPPRAQPAQSFCPPGQAKKGRC